MLIHRSITEPIRDNPDFSARWNSPDKGLITSWESGRKIGAKQEDLAKAAGNGQLVILPFKGGVEEPKKGTKTTSKKYGTLHYLAMWQGLRGEDLHIHTDQEVSLTCTVHHKTVVYTPNKEKYSKA